MLRFTFANKDSHYKNTIVIETSRKNRKGKYMKPSRKIIYYTDDTAGDSFDSYHAKLNETIYPIPFLTNNQRVLISVCGPSGVGKSTICARLIDELNNVPFQQRTK